jgi:hypothetical protein
VKRKIYKDKLAIMADFYEFVTGSPLRRFIYNMKKTIKIYYQLDEVITIMREIIRENCLYDKTNTAVIVCDSELEKVFNTNGMHVSELKGKILEQLILVTEPLQGRLRAAWQRHVAEQAAGAPAPADADPEPEPENRNDTATTSKIEHQRVATVYRCDTIPKTVYTDEHARFLVSQGLTEVLCTLPEFDRSKHTFSYRQIVPLVALYFINNKAKLFDPRNGSLACLKEDPLGKVFGVQYVHETQIRDHLKRQVKYVGGAVCMPSSAYEPKQSTSL